MATIGLDKLYYAKITEDANGEETYATPLVLAKAITAELSVDLIEAILYADDGAAEYVYRFAPLVGIYGAGMPGFIHMPLAVLAGFLAAGLWGMLIALGELMAGKSGGRVS